MKFLSVATLSVLFLAGCQTAPVAYRDDGTQAVDNRIVSSGINGVYSGGDYMANQGLSNTYSSGAGDVVVIRPKSDAPSLDVGETEVTTSTDFKGSSYRRDTASTGDFYNHPNYGQDVVGGPKAVGKDRVIYFAYDSSEIDDRAKSIVKQHAGYLKQHPKTNILLEGHTDSRGSRGYNIALGERRAVSVLKLFKAQGVPMSQIRVISYGEERPAVSGFNEEAYQRNRRAVIKY